MTEKERRDGIKDGDEFGQWTVVQKGERTPEYWLCQCVCGAKREVCPRSLVRGRSTCCGPKCPAKPRKTDVVVPGAKLEKWTVLSYEGQNGPQPLWKCRCECGNERVVQIHNVLSGTSESCGECGPHRHGEGMKTPEYISWQSMHGRCRRRTHHAWDRYTSKNIKICQRWFLYVQFLEDMGRRPSKDHTLDRIKNDKGYSCGKCEECRANGWEANCRWATWEQQQNNRDNTVQVTYRGEQITLTELAKRTGMDRGLLYSRIRKGLTGDEAADRGTSCPGSPLRGKRRSANVQ
jgi:hypothetical protein